MIYLKQSTAKTIPLGPFLDEDDGKTTEEALTIAQADIRLSKDGAAFAQTNNATGATHDEKGWYPTPLDTTDTATVGPLKVAIHVTGALPVWEDFMVVPANVYDSLISGTDSLEVDTVAISGDTTSADNCELDYDGTGYAKANSTIGTCTTNTDVVSVSDILTTDMVEAYAGQGAARTISKILFNIEALISRFSISGTTYTSKKIDNSSTAKTYTLDSDTAPTSLTENS